MDKQNIKVLLGVFDSIAKRAENSTEYWYARDLQVVLGYSKWDNFNLVIKKSMTACENVGVTVSDHFLEVGKMVELGSASKREITDFMLTRYACYLIAQNGDSKKEEISFAQSYFAIQTRKQELIEERLELIARMDVRVRLRESEKQLSQNLYERGIDDKGFGRIRSNGDKALFGGNTTKDMKNKLEIKDNRALADFLPTLTIAAKNLANEMTNHNVIERNLQGENPITYEHVQNNSSVREMLGKRGIKPENIPASEDIKKLERRVKTQEMKIARVAGTLPSGGEDEC